MRWTVLWLCLAFAAIPTPVKGDSPFSPANIAAIHEGRIDSITLRSADGISRTFQFSPTGFLPPESRIRTFRGVSISGDASALSLVVTSNSVSAQLFTPAGIEYLNFPKPESTYSAQSSYVERSASYKCLTAPAEPLPSSAPSVSSRSFSALSAGHTLRRFRLATAATAEFTQYFGSKERAIQEVVTAINRASEIFHRELGISFQLVPGFEQMVFTNPATDPYTSNEPTEKTLGEAQAAFDSIIGTENYDLGIVLTRGNYGLAYIRSVCDPARKGASCIGLPEPAGDAFHVNLVTHELGHQLGANHTFNSPVGLCSERRNPWTSFERGAGSTVMSYAGFPCGDDVFQSHHDPYFHSESIKEIYNFVTSPAVSCAQVFPADNSAPSVDAGREYYIPVATPFALTATGSDPDGDSLTFCWEQRDLGPAQTIHEPDNGLSPLFRSYSPTESPTRLFPSLRFILAGTDAPAERLPVTNRVLRFLVTARDSRQNGANAWSDTHVHVTNIAGPFRITSHNHSQVLSGTTRIEWSTGGTTQAPISASQVRILLSTDSGSTFPIVLADSTANDGSEEVTLPTINASDVRLKVQPTNNIFFDINDAPLSISSTPALVLSASPSANGTFQLSWNSTPGRNYTVQQTTDPNGSWDNLLETNSPQSSISIPIPTNNRNRYYRLIEN